MKKLKAFSKLTREDLLDAIAEEYETSLKSKSNSLFSFYNNDNNKNSFVIDDFQCTKCFKKTILGKHYEMEIALDNCYYCGMIGDDFRTFCSCCAKRIIFEFFYLVTNSEQPSKDDLVYHFTPATLTNKKVQKRFHYAHLLRQYSIAKEVEIEFFHDANSFFQPINDDYINRSVLDLFDDQNPNDSIN